MVGNSILDFQNPSRIIRRFVSGFSETDRFYHVESGVDCKEIAQKLPALTSVVASLFQPQLWSCRPSKELPWSFLLGCWYIVFVI